MFLDVLADSASEKCGLTFGKPILAGVSGGADSLTLLVGMVQLGYDLVVAHLDHALHPESAEDAAFVAKLAKAGELPFVSARVDVAGVAAQEGMSVEEAAREVRYRFLFEQARQHGAQAVAVAHHADDQVETVLMHFLRGAALPGLSGMAFRRQMPNWDPDIPLVRPLLGIWREEIEAFVADAGLTPREDASNRDQAYFRNRLRHALLPELETYNPRIRQVLWRTADVLGEEDRTLETLTDDAWEACFAAESSGRVELQRGPFLTHPKALQRRLLRRAIARLRPDLRDIGFQTVERGLAFAETPCESREIDLAARLNLAAVGELLIVKTWETDLPVLGMPQLPEGWAETTLAPGKPAALQQGWQIEVEVLPELPAGLLDSIGKTSADEAWLDADLLEERLTVRGRKAGERWQPLGMGGHHQTLQDFFINQKVPAHLRDGWPLVCSAGRVAWAVALRPSEIFKVSEDTQRTAHLRLVRGPSV